MIYIKDKKAILKMRDAGRLLSGVFNKISRMVKEGISTLDLDASIEKEMLSVGLKPECKGYRGYKHATCISVNDGVVHGVPSKAVVLKSGDLVKVDIVASYKGYCADMARCFFVGEVSSEVRGIATISQKALDAAINKAVVGNRVDDISVAVETVVKEAGYGIVRTFAGHGIGKYMHEDPEVPNYTTDGNSPLLRAGMTLAIEPMVTERGESVYIEKDGWTVKTSDGGLSGHVEDTVLITDHGPEVLTRASYQGGGAI